MTTSLSRRAAASCFMPGIFESMPACWPMLPIIWRMKTKRSRRLATSSIFRPEPLATRSRRLGCFLKSEMSLRSCFVIELTMALARTSSFSSTLKPSGMESPNIGSFSKISCRGPMFWSIEICSRKSSRVKSPWSIRMASSSAFSSSTTPSKSFIRPTTSPMPRMRLAMPSGRNSSILSRVSPIPTNFTGAPVTSCTDSAAPPRASPSSLVSTTPSRLSLSWKAFAVFTAS